MNNYLKKVIGLVLAASLVIGVSFMASDAKLRATDAEVLPEAPVEEVSEPAPAPAEPAPAEPVPAEPAVEENTDYTVSEVVPAEESAAPAEEEPAEEAPSENTPAPAEETAPAEGTDAEKPAEENAEEEKTKDGIKAFDVVEAYKYYMTLSDAEKEAYLNSLTPEQREALLKYIDELEQAEKAKAEKEKAKKDLPGEEVTECLPVQEEEKDNFDAGEACGFYMSISEEAQEAYVTSLTPEHEAALQNCLDEIAAQEEAENRAAALAVKYAGYLSLTEEAREEYLATLTPEEQEALLKYAEEAAEEAEEPSKPEIDFSKLKYSFTSDHAGQQVEPGTEITLTANLIGFEGLDYTCYWQSSPDGSSYTDAGTGDTFSFTATEENADWYWRLAVGVRP